MRLAVALLALLLAVLAPAQNYATERFDVAIRVPENRRVVVEETIAVRFLRPQRGLIRTVPIEATGSEARRRRIRVSLLGAELDTGSGYQRTDAVPRTESGTWTVRMGNPRRQIAGRAKFRLRYQVDGILTNLSDSEGERVELFWRAVPTRWRTPIEASAVTVTVPKLPAGTKGRLVARALIGAGDSRRGLQLEPGKNPVGRADLLEGSVQNGTFQFVAKKRLALGEGLTVIVSIPGGVIADAPALGLGGLVGAEPGPGTGARPSAPRPSLPLTAYLPLLGPIALIPFLRKFRRPERRPMTVRFEPPPGIGPGEAGLIIDGNVDRRDIVAGIVSLGQKGALKIRHTQGQPPTLELTPGATAKEPLTHFEADLWARLEPYGPIISPESLRGNFGHDYKALTRSLEAWRDQRQLLKPGFSTWQTASGCGCFLLIALGALLGLAFAGPPALLAAIVGGFGGLLLIRRASDLSREGAIARWEMEGLREFITRAQAAEYRAMVERDPDQALFERLLPYAVAFGAVKQWAEFFKGIELAPPDWYATDDYADFSTGLWTGLIVSDLLDLDRSYGSAIDYQPSDFGGGGGTWASGDSGFGGGGFDGYDSDSGSFDSGGSVDDGGGGGGGDSW